MNVNSINSSISVNDMVSWFQVFKPACNLSCILQVLQLSTDAKEDEIKKQYRKVSYWLNLA